MKPIILMGSGLGGFPMGLALGAGAIVLVTSRRADLGGQVRPLFKAALKGVFRFGELGREWAARVVETVDDVHAEVRAELVAERAARAAAVVASDTVVTSAMDVDDTSVVIARTEADPDADDPDARTDAADDARGDAPHAEHIHRAVKGARSGSRAKRHDMEAG